MGCGIQSVFVSWMRLGIQPIFFGEGFGSPAMTARENTPGLNGDHAPPDGDHSAPKQHDRIFGGC